MEIKTEKVVCEQCDGTGENKAYPERTCFSCDGKGIYEKEI